MSGRQPRRVGHAGRDCRSRSDQPSRVTPAARADGSSCERGLDVQLHHRRLGQRWRSGESISSSSGRFSSDSSGSLKSSSAPLVGPARGGESASGIRPMCFERPGRLVGEDVLRGSCTARSRLPCVSTTREVGRGWGSRVASSSAVAGGEEHAVEGELGRRTSGALVVAWSSTSREVELARDVDVVVDARRRRRRCPPRGLVLARGSRRSRRRPEEQRAAGARSYGASEAIGARSLSPGRRGLAPKRGAFIGSNPATRHARKRLARALLEDQPQPLERGLGSGASSSRARRAARLNGLARRAGSLYVGRTRPASGPARRVSSQRRRRPCVRGCTPPCPRSTIRRGRSNSMTSIAPCRGARAARRSGSGRAAPRPSDAGCASR